MEEKAGQFVTQDAYQRRACELVSAELNAMEEKAVNLSRCLGPQPAPLPHN